MRNSKLIRWSLASWMLLLLQLLSGQVSISGTLLDESSKETIAYATVSLHDERDSSLVGGTLSGEDGGFLISTGQRGKLLVYVSYLGYTPKWRSIFVGEKNDILFLGKILLAPAATTLKEITVSGERATVNSGLDRKSFDLSDQSAQTAGSVLDAMKALPGVSTSQDGKLLLRGSDQVAVLIDGKQSAITGYGNQRGLDNIPAANIARIEIINNPSAKYDATGMAGIINIIYKENKASGFNGEIGLSYALGEITNRRADLPTELGHYDLNNRLIPNLSLNYRTAKFRSWFQGEMLRQQRLPNNEFTTRYYTDGRSTVSQVPENRKQTHYILKSGIDYLANEHDTYSLSAIYDYELHTDTAQVPFINLATNRRYRYWHWRERESTGLFNVKADYRHNFGQAGHELSLATQYTRASEDESYFLNDSTALRQANDTTHLVAIERTLALNLDYVRPLGSGRIEAGAKLQGRNIPVTYEVGRGERSIIYPGLGDNSKWTEDLYAAYLNYVYERPGFDVEFGLRAEQVSVTYDLAEENIYYARNDAYDYFRLYPNFRFTYKANDRNSISLFFNRRVDRPGEPELRAFPKYDDPELLKVGNPYLRPQFTQTVELAYRRNWESGSVFAALYNRDIDDAFLRIFDVDDSNPDYDIINRSYQNVGHSANRGLELLLSQEVGKSWKTSLGFNFYQIEIDAFTGNLLFPTVRPFDIEATTSQSWDLKFNNRLKLPKDYQVQLTAVYIAPKNIPQGRELARSSVDLGVTKAIWKKKGELVFSATDLFNGFGLRQEIKGADFTALYENYYESQVVRVGLKYKW